MWWLAIVIPAVLLSVLGVLLWLGRREHRSTANELSAIRDMPDAAAERYVLELLERPGLFKTRKAPGALANPNVPVQVSALLSNYEEIVCGEFWVGVDALSQHPRLPGYIKIGGDSEFTELLVKPGDQSIYISYGEGANSTPSMEVEPSIWHAIIIGSGVLPEVA